MRTEDSLGWQMRGLKDILSALRLKLDSLTLCIKEYYELKLNLEYASKFVWEANSSLRMSLRYR
jgi:hypothetical protein